MLEPLRPCVVHTKDRFVKWAGRGRDQSFCTLQVGWERRDMLMLSVLEGGIIPEHA